MHCRCSLLVAIVRPDSVQSLRVEEAFVVQLAEPFDGLAYYHKIAFASADWTVLTFVAEEPSVQNPSYECSVVEVKNADSDKEVAEAKDVALGKLAVEAKSVDPDKQVVEVKNAVVRGTSAVAAKNAVQAFYAYRRANVQLH